jgi:hypothetical protein
MEPSIEPNHGNRFGRATHRVPRSDGIVCARHDMSSRVQNQKRIHPCSLRCLWHFTCYDEAIEDAFTHPLRCLWGATSPRRRRESFGVHAASVSSPQRAHVRSTNAQGLHGMLPTEPIDPIPNPGPSHG